jgi:hypothetical protein
LSAIDRRPAEASSLGGLTVYELQVDETLWTRVQNRLQKVDAGEAIAPILGCVPDKSHADITSDPAVARAMLMYREAVAQATEDLMLALSACGYELSESPPPLQTDPHSERAAQRRDQAA